MKKCLLVIAVLINTFFCVAFAETKNQELLPDSSNKISAGGLGFLGINRSGGAGEFGITLFTAEPWNIRNYIRLGGFALENNMVFLLTERVAFSNKKVITPNFSLSHFYMVETTFSGFYNDKKANMFTAPYIFDFKIGSGLEFTVGKSNYFIELTFGYALTTSGTYKEHLGAKPLNATLGLGSRRFF